jgi:glutamate 5-kinase
VTLSELAISSLSSTDPGFGLNRGQKEVSSVLEVAVAQPVQTVRTVVVKIGTSSITDSAGVLAKSVITQLCDQVHHLRTEGWRVVVVSSGAVAAGLEALGISRPNDVLTKQAVSAVGQSRLMRMWDESFAAVGLVSGQALLTPHDFFDRTQYLHARNTFQRLLELGVVPVVNENDALADDELRFGDNDRIAALVAHLVNADLLVLLTDMNGLYTDDPRRNPDARLIDSLAEVTPEIEALAGGTGTSRGSGGMSSKVTAARMASVSGIRAIIANATRPNVLVDGAHGALVGTTVAPLAKGMTARKLWIGFAVEAAGQVVVDVGARAALTTRGVSLLPAGVVDVVGEFSEGDAVEVQTPDGAVFARGLVRHSAGDLRRFAGKRSDALPEDSARVAIHCDDLVILTAG